MNNFIRENLTEDEIDLILTRFAEVKRARFGRVDATFQDGKIIQLNKVFSENPATFKTVYSVH